MRHWLQKFARNFPFIQRLRRPPRRPVRVDGFLRVEVLEDRSVPSALSDEVSSVVYASLSANVTMSPGGAAVTLTGGSVSTAGLSGPGLDRLIEAIQQLEPSASELTTPPVTVVLPFSAEAVTLAVVPEGEPGGLSLAFEFMTAPGGTTTSGGPGKVGIPASPASTQTVVVPGGTGTAADSVGEGSVSAGAPQGGSGRVGDLVPTASIFLAPVVPEVRQPAIPGLAPSGPAALQVPQSAFPDSHGPPEVTGTPPPIAPGGTSAASPRATPSPGADATTESLIAPGTDVGICPPQGLPDATGAGSTGGGSTGPRSPLADLSDGSLLQRFAANREQAAFTTLVRRYEPSVLQVCTEVLGDSDRARDASQATFQVLARRAGALDGRAPLRGWLSTVAYHLALRFRADDVRRRQLERASAVRVTAVEEVDPATDLEREELRAVIGEELDRLPTKYRVPLVLYYLEGWTHAEVAREIGLPKGSVARRIGDRLVARGFPF